VVNVYNHCDIIIKLGLSFALPSNIIFLISQHVNSVFFIEERSIFGASAYGAVFVTPSKVVVGSNK